MDDASGLMPTRDVRGRFGPGNPGRPRGARSRISRRVALGLLRYFEAHEDQIFEKLNSWQHVPVYMRLIERLLPQALDDDGPDLERLSPEEQVRAARAVRAALDRVEANGAALTEIEDALAGAGWNHGSP